jgi:predicted Rossmann-fold nucleotide-binding protein
MSRKGPYTEIESIEALVQRLQGGGTLADVVVQGLDLRSPSVVALLETVSADGAHFLGCRLSPMVERHIRSTGGTIFPAFHGLPFNPFRSSLYSPAELMHGYRVGAPSTLDLTVDSTIYHFFQQHRASDRPPDILTTLAFRVHDHAIDDALVDLLAAGTDSEKRVVGVMGGHSLRRDDPLFFDVARIGYYLARKGFFVATGGGPGAMEAANLGAYLSEYAEDDLLSAVEMLKPSPGYTDPDYVDRAYDVTSAYPSGRESLAIPTWFYGHEPSNLFSLRIAKYFANSIREDGLLAVATCGVIYAPGSAGTIQEIFMDAAQNHYETVGWVSPMVFLGQEYWTRHRPVIPLLSALANGRVYGSYLSLTDSPSEAVEFVEQNPPLRTAT